MKQTLRKWVYFTKAIITNFHPDLIASYTASVAWFIMLSFLPFMIVLLSLVRFLPFLQDESVTLNTEFIPGALRGLLQFFVNEIVQNTSNLALPLGALTGLISASTGFSSLIKGLNVIYKHRENRPLWRVRLMCLVYTIVFLFVLIAVLVLIVFGKALYRSLSQTVPPLSSGLLRFINWRLWAVVLVLTLFFTLLYNIVPNRRSQWRYEVPGAFLAAWIWIAFSHLYSLYISNFNRFSMIYGSLTLIILLMIWLYACILIVFIGAYANVLLQDLICYKRMIKEKGIGRNG